MIYCTVRTVFGTNGDNVVNRFRVVKCKSHSLV